MNTRSFKRYIVPLFAFFLMLAAARAEGDTVSTWQWQVEYGTIFQSLQYSKTDKYIVAQGKEEYYFIEPQTGVLIKKVKNRVLVLNEEDFHLYGRISFINNDTEFLYESEDRKTIDCYDANDLTIKYSLEAPGGEIREYNISKDEKQVVARIGLKQIKVWDLASKEIIASYTYPTYENEIEGQVVNPRFTPDGKKIIAGTHIVIKTGISSEYPYYHSEEYRNIIVFNTKLDSIGNWTIWDRLVWSKSGKLIASVNGGGNEWLVRVFDSENFNELYTIHTGAYGAVTEFFFSDDEKYFVIPYGSNLYICKVFRLADGKNTINYHPGNSTSCAYLTTSGACLSNLGNDLVVTTCGCITKYAFYPTTSIEYGYFDNGIISYPNPIQGGGVLKFKQEKPGTTNIYISNEKGTIVKEICNTFYEAGQQTVIIDVSELPNGAYFISVNCNNQNFTQKIIVNK